MTFGCLESVDFFFFFCLDERLRFSPFGTQESFALERTVHLFAQQRNTDGNEKQSLDHRYQQRLCVYVLVEVIVFTLLKYSLSSLAFFSISLARIKRVSLLCSLSRCRFHWQSGRAWNSFCLPLFCEREEEEVRCRRLNT